VFVNDLNRDWYSSSKPEMLRKHIDVSLGVTPPNIPLSLSVSNITSTKATITYAPPGSGSVPTEYTISYGLDGGSFLTAVTTTSTAYTLTGLVSSTNYTACVQAVSGSTVSSAGALINFKTAGPGDQVFADGTGPVGEFTGFDVIVCAGQSNNSYPYAPGDHNVDAAQIPDGSILMWDTSSGNVSGENVPTLAGDPVIIQGGYCTNNFTSSYSQFYIPPCMPFAKAYREKNASRNRKVLLVVTGVPGTQLTTQWSVGQSLYLNCIAQANAAMAYGPVPSGNNLVCMTWVQGENDSIVGITGAVYDTAFRAMILGFRSTITRATNMPFVISSIGIGARGPFVVANPAAVYMQQQYGIIGVDSGPQIYVTGSQIDSVQKALPHFLPYTYYIPAYNSVTGLVVHFLAPDQRQIGLNQLAALNMAQGNIAPDGLATHTITDVITCSASSGALNSTVVSWTTPLTGTGTPIQYSVVYYTAAAKAAYLVLNSATSPKTITGLTGGTQYFIYVMPYNTENGWGPSSNVVTATPSGGGTPPNDVTGAAAGTVTLSTIPVTWASGGGSPTGFKLYYRFTGGGGYTLSNTVSGGGSTSGTVTGLAAHIAYDLKIVATNGNGDAPGVGAGCLITNVFTANITWSVSSVPTPIGWWRMKGDPVISTGVGSGNFNPDGTSSVINDYTGNGNNGLITGGTGIAFNSDLGSVRGTVLRYPSQGSINGVGTTMSWPLICTFSCWVYSTVAGASINSQISQGGSASGAIVLFLFQNTLVFSTDGTTNYIFTAYGPGFTINTWYHIVVVYAASGSTTIYVNGASAAGPTVDPNYAAYAASPRINAIFYNNSNTNNLIGQITDFCVFNYALSGPQVTALYNAQLVPGDTHSIVRQGPRMVRRPHEIPDPNDLPMPMRLDPGKITKPINVDAIMSRFLAQRSQARLTAPPPEAKPKAAPIPATSSKPRPKINLSDSLVLDYQPRTLKVKEPQSDDEEFETIA
jgi:hypothetical protein